MVRLLHGTSADNLHSILEYGLNLSQAEFKRNWTCSNPTHIYFWHPLRQEGDTYTERWQEAFRQAAYSAEFSLFNAKDCRRLVLEVNVPSKDFRPDYSCENMDAAGAVVVARAVRPEEITRMWIDTDTLDFFRAYFAGLRFETRRGGGLQLRQYAEALDLSDAEEAMVKAIFNSTYTCCEIHEKLSELIGYMEELSVPRLALAS